MESPVTSFGVRGVGNARPEYMQVLAELALLQRFDGEPES